MKDRINLKQRLQNDLLILESDLTRNTAKQHKKAMRYVNKLHRLVEKYYEEK